MENSTLHHCITCRYFEISELGYSVEGLEDTLCLEEACGLLGWERKEYPLMEPVVRTPDGRVLLKNHPFFCPYWEA